MCEIPGSAISRRKLLQASLVGAVAASFTLPFAVAGRAVAQTMPAKVGDAGRRTLIRGGHVMSMDASIGNLASGDVLVEGSRIVEIGRSIHAPDAAVIEAAGRVVMPGFIDTHHHQFETALRSFLSDGIMLPDAARANEPNYMHDILSKFAPVYRPEDVYIAQLFGGLSQLDAGVTTVMDVSQIHHSPEHSDAVIEGMRAVGRRGVFGYFEGSGPRSAYPRDARRLRTKVFASDDQMLTMAMGGEVYMEGVDPLDLWRIGQDLDLPIALHVVGSLGMRETMDRLIPHFTDRHIFIHMTGMSDAAWSRAREVGAHVSLAVPIEMHMRHGMPPLQKAIDAGLTPSLSSDVECTMSADFFTQMRAALTLQRALANEAALSGDKAAPALLGAKDVLRFATVNAAKGLGLDHKVGSLTPGRQADIILLNADALNVAPLNNVAGAVVTLMDRSNVETVLCGGQIRKWQGAMVGHDIASLRNRIVASRDYLFGKAGVAIEAF